MNKNISEDVKSFRRKEINNDKMNIFSSDFKLGLLGGGQLGKMMIQASLDFDIFIKCLDPDKECSCHKIASEFQVGSLLDFDTVYNFGLDCDVITIEIENVNINALEKLENEGKKVFPQPKVLRIIQDKRTQKTFYVENNIPTSPFILTENIEEIKNNANFLPAFNKIGKGGYDGKGVQKLNSIEDLTLAFKEPSLLEKTIDFDKEIGIIIARNQQGETAFFPTVEMVFHPELNLVDYLFAPAQISSEINEKAIKIAKSVAEKLDVVGILAVEMFLCKDGEILVNEVAPRTHNSGHHTLRANMTSQFEQHLRAILNLPLGDTSSKGMSAMLNILGEVGYEGLANYEGMEDCLKVSGIFPYLYGKKITKPNRKMGHVSVIGSSMKELDQKLKFVQENLKCISK